MQPATDIHRTTRAAWRLAGARSWVFTPTVCHQTGHPWRNRSRSLSATDRLVARSPFLKVAYEAPVSLLLASSSGLKFALG